MSEMINIPGRLHAADSEGIVTGANEVFDDNLGATQEDLNTSTLANLETLQEGLGRKQNILTPGTGITISQDGTISTIIDGSIGKIVTDHTAITTPVEGLLYLEQTSTQGTYAQYIYEDEEWSSLGNITLSFGLDDIPTAGSDNVAKSGGTKQYIDTNTSKEDKNIFDSSIFVNDGFVRPNGTTSSGVWYKYSNKLDVSNYNILKITIRVGSSSVSPAVFYDENEDYISGITATSGISQVDTMYIDVPTTAKYVVISGASSYFSNFAISGLYKIADYIDEVVSSLQTREELYALSCTDYRNIGCYRPNGSFNDNKSYRYSEYIDVSNYTTLYIHSSVGSVGVSPAVFFDGEQNFISGITATITTETDYEINVPTNAKYVIVSSIFNKIGVFKLQGAGDLSKTVKADTIYIAANGIDTNSGLTENSPIYSFTAAKNKLKRNGTLIFLEGEYENYELDLSWFAKIIGKGNVKFVNYLQKITEGTPVDGYTKVLSTALTSPFAISSQGVIYHRYFYQHNINDAATLIASGEVHPLHRGKTHRLPSTRVYKVNSIAEVESSDIPAFYYDHSTTTIYFSKVEDSSLETNPIIIPHTNPYTATEKNSVYIDNIKVLYKNILTTYMYGILSNVSVGMCYGAGAFRLDNTKGLQLINCEAYACENDGFNTHNSNLSVTKSSEITLIDCYGHDNGDDGESAHKSSLITQHGGLYEYNGNGCTPASGAAGIYYNVLVRNNGDHAWVIDNMGTGFSCQGSASGNSYMECYNCVSENNKIGFNNTANRGTAFLTNCIAVQNDTSNYVNVNIRTES